jgi:hypothetical protein
MTGCHFFRANASLRFRLDTRHQSDLKPQPPNDLRLLSQFTGYNILRISRVLSSSGAGDPALRGILEVRAESLSGENGQCFGAAVVQSPTGYNATQRQLRQK